MKSDNDTSPTPRKHQVTGRQPAEAAAQASTAVPAHTITAKGTALSQPAPSVNGHQPATAAQQQSGSDQAAKKAGKPIAISEHTARQFGITAESDTSLVLVLTAKAGLQPSQQQQPAWRRLPPPSDSNSRSAAAVSQLLDKLDIHPQPLPELYGQCDTAEELTEVASKRWNGDSDSELAMNQDWGLEPAAAEGQSQLATALHQHAYAIADLAQSKELTSWIQLLTPHTGCMNGRQYNKQTATTIWRPDGSRCVLRLDFTSPLVRVCIEHQLRHYAANRNAMAESEGSSDTLTVDIDVQRYRRPLITARVVGFAMGPIDPTTDTRSESKAYHTATGSFSDPICSKRRPTARRPRDG